MNKTFAVVMLASVSLFALFCVSWWGDVFSGKSASPAGFSTSSSSVATKLQSRENSSAVSSKKSIPTPVVNNFST